MLRAEEAGGPTGTMREPNSTPMVTSCRGEKRPSHKRMVNYDLVSHGTAQGRANSRIFLSLCSFIFVSIYNIHLIFQSPNHQGTLFSQYSPMMAASSS